MNLIEWIAFYALGLVAIVVLTRSLLRWVAQKKKMRELEQLEARTFANPIPLDGVILAITIVDSQGNPHNLQHEIMEEIPRLGGKRKYLTREVIAKFWASPQWLPEFTELGLTCLCFGSVNCHPVKLADPDCEDPTGDHTSCQVTLEFISPGNDAPSNFNDFYIYEHREKTEPEMVQKILKKMIKDLGLSVDVREHT